MPTQYPPITPSSYVSPLPYGNFTFVSAHTIFPYEQSSAILNMTNEYTQEVMGPLGELLFKNTYKIINNAYEQSQTEGSDIGTTISLGSGAYTVKYTYKITSQVPATTPVYQQIEATYTFGTAPNQYPLKKWTITDVINRLLDIAEPIRRGEEPRFKLSAEQAVLFDKILAPQFSFTKSTLRECLQECGKVIHGEPRLDVKEAEGGGFYFEVSFDLYGQTERSHIAERRYITKTVSQAIDSYATHLDSNAENLVNQLDKYAGVIVEPYAGGFKTVRTETMYARITDTNMLIQTQYPIYTVSKLECGIIPQNESAGDLFDITPYLFESSIYNTRLSSYSDEYPNSKAYGIYYTQGQRNIGGLSFKQEHPISSVFEKYAIINILERITNQTITIDSPLESGSGDEYKYQAGNYPLLAFRVTYTPIYNSRVSQTKTNYLDYPYGAALVFNQQANIVEARYFGENLKGTIARIGNVEKSYTYNLTRLDQIPKAGQMFDEDYFISAVSVEFLPVVIKCTISLSRDFNRLSRYIGISSVKRFSEVSETQALERNTLWKEYIVIGDDIMPDSDTYIEYNFMAALREALVQSSPRSRITTVFAWGETYDGAELNPVNLPVVSSAFGNSIVFSWTYEDNYSAGAIAQYAEKANGNRSVNGYFQNNYQYTDYYGKIYYYNFDLRLAGEVPGSFNLQTTIGMALPGSDETSASRGYISTVDAQPIILRKDNREKLQCNFQIDFVTNRKGLIIGSALAAYCPAVRGWDTTLTPRLYIFDQTLDKFINHLEGSTTIDLTTAKSYPVSVSALSANYRKFSVTADAFATSGKSWAIVTAQTEQSETVEDEEGNVTTQTVQYGGDVLLAQNMDISAGQAFAPIYFNAKRKIFKEDVWIANK